MYAIETELGRFEGANEREAKKKLKAAQAKARAEEKVRSDNYDLARLRAQSIAYNVLCRVAEGAKMYRAWELFFRGDRMFPEIETPEWGGGYRDFIANYETEYGAVKNNHGSHVVEAVVANGAVYHVLTFVKIDEESTCYAIGVAGDQIALVPVPGVTMELFQKEPANAQPA